MSWKEYDLEDGSKFYLSLRDNLSLSVQYNAVYNNWHYCCWNRDNLDKYLIDTESSPHNGFKTCDDAKKAADTWYNNFI